MIEALKKQAKQGKSRGYWDQQTSRFPPALKAFCVVQCSMWWFSAPTSLNSDLLNDGVFLEKYK